MYEVSSQVHTGVRCLNRANPGVVLHINYEHKSAQILYLYLLNNIQYLLFNHLLYIFVKYLLEECLCYHFYKRVRSVIRMDTEIVVPIFNEMDARAKMEM